MEGRNAAMRSAPAPARSGSCVDLAASGNVQRLFGNDAQSDEDHVLRVLAPKLTTYQGFYDAELGDLPGALRLSSTMMKRIDPDRTIPLDR